MIVKLTKNDYLNILFLGLFAATPAVSTDIYLPAIPQIARDFHSTESIINLSLTLFFVSFSVSLLISGPISDKVGRKPVLLTGLFFFIIASALSAFTTNPTELILSRVLQGLSAGAPSAMAMAIARDKYSGVMRQLIFAYVASILAIAPMLAPSIGAIIIKYGEWHTIFIAQSVLAMISFISGTFLKESQFEKSTAKVINLFARYKPLLQNQKFIKFCGFLTLINLPYFAFIALSPIVYLKIFKVSEIHYGLFFGFNAFMAMLGALSFSKLIKRYLDTELLNFALISCLIGAGGILFFGAYNEYTLAGFMAVFSFSTGIGRPIYTSIILDQVNSDIGSASSFLMFYQFLMGGLAMAFVSIPWEHPILIFGLMALTLISIVLFFWKRSFQTEINYAKEQESLS